LTPIPYVVENELRADSFLGMLAEWKRKKFLPQMSDALNSFGRRRRKAHSKKHVLSEAPVSGKWYRYTGIYRYKIFKKYR
jgi:hypothetical protein